MDRHGRQTRLAEVGAAGQMRISSACVAVRLEGVAGAVAVRYLAGAGAGDLRVPSLELAAQARAVDPAIQVEVDAALRPSGAPPASPFSLRHPSADALALGAYTALVALRDALRHGPGGATA
jgi:hypothetical protein